MLKLRGAFEENQTLETTKLRYYINKDLETEVGVVSFHCFVSVIQALVPNSVFLCLSNL